MNTQESRFIVENEVVILIERDSDTYV